MKEKRLSVYIKICAFIILALFFAVKPIEAKAVSISIQSISFDDHKGMMAYINGESVYCIQRSYPFRSKVSDLQMVTATTHDVSGNEHHGTIAKNIRDLFVNLDVPNQIKYFVGWGDYEINGDHTNAYQIDTSGAPSSAAWQEAFTEFMEDEHQNDYDACYHQSSCPYKLNGGNYCNVQPNGGK